MSPEDPRTQKIEATQTKRRLDLLIIDPHDPAACLDDLERALVGQCTLLPVPREDAARRRILQDSQKAGHPINPEIALVMATSGSTGTPKGAMLSPTNLISSADATHHALGGPGQWLLAMPAHHIAGIQVLIRSLVAGVDPLCLDLSDGFKIPEFIAKTQELVSTGDRSYTALTPMQLAKAMDSLAGIEALRSFDGILIGGAPLPVELAESARELGIIFHTTYGSSETSGGCVYNGIPLRGVHIKVDADSRVLLSGPMIAHGYRNAPNHEAFSEPGWFRTSDSGRIHDGKLEIIGRMDTIIDSGGLKLHPEIVEKALLSMPGVKAACALGVPHPRLGQAVVAAYVGAPSPMELMTFLHEGALERWQIPKELKQVDSLPTTALGKVDRPKLQALF